MAEVEGNEGDAANIIPIQVVADHHVVSDVLGVINVFEQMLLAMEARLIRQLDTSQQMARDRLDAMEQRLTLVEASFDAHMEVVRHEDLVMAARVMPVKQTFGWLWRNWRDLLLLVLGLAAVATFVSNWITGRIGV